MKNFYDVAGSSSLYEREPPRIVQVHLKSRIAISSPPRNPLNESYLNAISNDTDINSEVLNNSVQNEKSRGRKRILRMESFKSSLQKIPTVQRNISYWLSFPAAMRKVLMHPRDSDGISLSNISVLNSEDISWSDKRTSDSLEIIRNNSRKGSFRSQKVYFDSSIPESTENVWPRGHFSEAEKKIVENIWQNNYQITWKEDDDSNNNVNTSNTSEDYINTVSFNKSFRENRRPSCRNHVKRKSFSAKDFRNSPEIRRLYGYSSDDSPKKRCLPKFTNSCCF